MSCFIHKKPVTSLDQPYLRTGHAVHESLPTAKLFFSPGQEIRFKWVVTTEMPSNNAEYQVRL